MAGWMEKGLRRLARFQIKHYLAVCIVALIITLILSIGISRISMQTDFSKSSPQDLEIIKLNTEVSSKFGGEDVVLIVVQLDKESGKENSISDIRDPKVVEFLQELGDSLSKESLVTSVRSVGDVFEATGNPQTLEQSKFIIEQTGAESFYNKDYSITLLYVFSDLSGGEEKVKELTEVIKERVDSSTKPSGVKISITGNPPLRVIIFKLLASDAIFTLSIAALIILLLLIVLERSFTKAFLIFIPLLLGIDWTLGLMGWLNIPLSVATVGIGAMILGLAVEYGVFIVSRYTEEKRRMPHEKALEEAVSGVGSAVIGSGGTTIVGFLALTLSAMPMLQDLGKSLALGITFCLVSGVFVNPSFMILEERMVSYFKKKREMKHKIGRKK